MSQSARAPRCFRATCIPVASRHVRVGGIDTAYDPHASCDALRREARTAGRALSTREVALLRPECQVAELCARYALASSVIPSRCADFDGEAESMPLETIAALLPRRVRASLGAFSRCTRCSRAYWPGSRVERPRACLATAGIHLWGGRGPACFHQPLSMRR